MPEGSRSSSWALETEMFTNNLNAFGEMPKIPVSQRLALARALRSKIDRAGEQAGSRAKRARIHP